MSARTSLLIASAATLMGGVSYAAISLGLAAPAMAAVAALAGGVAVAGVARNRLLSAELAGLRDHLETTRQQAAILARHTRELRESLVSSPVLQPDSGKQNASSPADFIALSQVVRDVADGLSELDRRTEALEHELSDVRRKQDMEARAASPSAGWVAPRQAGQSAAGQFQREQNQVVAPSRASVRDGDQGAALRPIPAAPEISRAPEAPRAVRQLIAAAIASDRFDLFLQRVVALPQRKIRGYDVTLRPDTGDLSITNEDIRLAVETLGHQLPFDRRLIIQTVRLARMFERRERDVVLFADISQRYLMSEAAFDEVSALVEEAPSAAQRIVLSLPQRFFKKAIAFEHEALRKLSDLGFRFQMRDIEDFEIEPQKLYQMGVRWVRADARQFVDTVASQPALLGVASADYVTMLARRKLDFLAANAGDDETIAELIDLGVGFGHGAVFAPPQAVRADALEDQQQKARSAPPSPVMDQKPPLQNSPMQERRGLRELVRRA